MPSPSPSPSSSSAQLVLHTSNGVVFEKPTVRGWFMMLVAISFLSMGLNLNTTINDRLVINQSIINEYSSRSQPMDGRSNTIETPRHSRHEQHQQHLQHLQQQPQPNTQTETRKKSTRVLLGIFTSDSPLQYECRNQFRLLLETYRNVTTGIKSSSSSNYGDDVNDRASSRVCSLGDFLDDPESFRDCQLVYTFVMGAARDPETAPTEIVDSRSPSSRPVVLQHRTAGGDGDGDDDDDDDDDDDAEKNLSHIESVDRSRSDMTLLNIRENMEKGKSQTWIYRAQQILSDHSSIDYVAKCDSDSVLDLNMFFAFTDVHLPPAPHNVGILAGHFYDKTWWGTSPAMLSKRDRIEQERFLQHRYAYSNPEAFFHLYAMGQLYILAPDLVDTVVSESHLGLSKSYSIGIEDHDISTMSFRTPNPVHMIFLTPFDMQFWEHPIKLKKDPDSRMKWELAWKEARDKLVRLANNATLLLPLAGNVTTLATKVHNEVIKTKKNNISSKNKNGIREDKKRNKNNNSIRSNLRSKEKKKNKGESLLIKQKIGFATSPVANVKNGGEVSAGKDIVPKYVDTIPINPRTSQPPQSIELFETDDPAIRVRHGCLANIRKRHAEAFGPWLTEDDSISHEKHYLLVDPAYHDNVGDHMLTIAELIFMQRMNYTSFDECGYIQSNGYAMPCDKYYKEHPPPLTSSNSSSNNTTHRLHPIAAWQAGGNWGDLYIYHQRPRIASLSNLLRDYKSVIGFPQSLYYKDNSKAQAQANSIKKNIFAGIRKSTTADMTTVELQRVAKSRVTFSWREHDSYERAKELYPFVTNVLVPDMAFELGPFNPIKPQFSVVEAITNTTTAGEPVDFVLFLRDDRESALAPQRNNTTIRSILSKIDGGKHSNLTFKVVDWGDRLNIFDSQDFLFTQTAVQLVSMGRVLICDRLHATILAYLTGIPFVYVDNITGKITKALRVAMESGGEGCASGDTQKWARGMDLEDAIRKAIGFL